jgi:hypothetical protein
MYKINDFLNFLKNKHFKSILMYNCENVSHNDLINLLNYNKYCIFE